LSISSSTRCASARQGQLLQPLLELVHLGGAVVLGDAELLLDRLELLAQEELALLLVQTFSSTDSRIFCCSSGQLAARC
jgi:hypothetical protein